MALPLLNYVDPPDVPAGMTLDEYRRRRASGTGGGRRTRRRWRRRLVLAVVGRGDRAA